MKKTITNILIFLPAVFLITSLVLIYALKSGPIKWTPLMLKREWQFRGTGTVSKMYWVPLQEISPNAIQAIVMSEDQRFMEHHGVDLVELERMLRSYKNGDAGLRGCSTITQQVAKNCFTFSSNTYLRKAMELYWASLMEIFWNKERILEVYMNVVEVGRGLYGVEAASREYFHCRAKEMTEHDAASLAVILPSPLTTSPSEAWTAKPERIERLVVELKRKKFPPTPVVSDFS